MKNIIKTILFFLILLSSCNKNTENLSDRIEIFSCGDCEIEDSYFKADKNVPEWGSKEWKASAIIYKSKADTSKWVLGAFTVDASNNIIREDISIDPIPLNIGHFTLKEALLGDSPPWLSYARIGEDGDFYLALYSLYPTTPSTITIDEINWKTKRVKGSFDFHFSKTSGMKALPDKVNFINGKFEAKIRD